MFSNLVLHFYLDILYTIRKPSESIGLKFIPIQSELIRYLYIRANANHSEPIWKTFCILFDENGEKSIRLNPINSETSIRMNPNQSETKFSIQINLSFDWPKLNFQSESIRMNPRSERFGLILIENSVWMHPSSDWIGLIWIENLVSDWFGFIRIDVSELIGLSRIDFSPLPSNKIQNVFQIGSEWFALARIQISELIEIVLIKWIQGQNYSDWI